MDILKHTKQEIKDFIEQDSDYDYINLLYSQNYFESKKREAFPEFTEMFDLIKFISNQLQEVTYLNLYQKRFEKCKLCFTKLENGPIKEAIKFDAENSANTLQEILDHENYVYVSELYNKYFSLSENFKEKSIKHSNEFIHDLNEIVKEFNNSPDKFLIKRKTKFLDDIKQAWKKCCTDISGKYEQQLITPEINHIFPKYINDFSNK